jgi:alpha-beta hydrolase superfamily lysophospholipase
MVQSRKPVPTTMKSRTKETEVAGLIFKQEFHDEFGTWPLAYIRYGGMDFGEILAVARAVGEGDDSAFYAAWMAAGDRFTEAAADALAKARRCSARALFLKASCAYGAAYHPLYGEPIDPRLLTAFHRQIDAFAKGHALSDPPLEPQRIPFEGGSLPAWFVPASDRTDAVRPLLILTNGYDATVTDMYFASAVAASRRGYHCLLFDGPGQGEMLYEHSVRLRPDWERVIQAVVDFAIRLPNVDPARIALSGWSLGGHLALRAAAGENRLAACIADPGLWSIAGGFRSAAVRLGIAPEAIGNLGEIDQALLDRLEQVIRNDRKLRWSVIQRGFWVHGTGDLRSYFRSIEQFTLAGRAEQIRCPTLLTWAQNDPLAASTETLSGMLLCPKALVRFTANEGAGEHCEMMNRSLLNDKVLDWLGDVLS